MFINSQCQNCAYKMDGIPIVLHKILGQSATVHIYSFPHFTLETFLAVVICIIYCYLHAEITNIGKVTLRLRPNTIHFKKPLKESYSKDSICTSITRIQHEYCSVNVSRNPSTQIAYKRLCNNCSTHSQLGWIMPHTMAEGATNARGQMQENRNRHAETLASLSPAEYVRRDKERRLREKELQKCFQSLTTLYDNVVEKKFSENTLTTHLELAKEQAQCTKMAAPPTILSLPADAMTKSLFDLLEKIVCTSSVSNPIPFKGDITSLALDAGNLKTKHSIMFDATCDLITESSSTTVTTDVRN